MNCGNCLNMKVRTAVIDKVASCKNGMNLDIYGRDKRFKNPDNLRLMKTKYKLWEKDDCEGFNSADEYEGHSDPCVDCEAPMSVTCPCVRLI